jgi:hypothetical protein
MKETSSKTEEVAVLPRFKLPLNLQLFAGETPELEDSQEFKEDLKEFTQFETKVAKFTEERQAKETQKETVEKPTENKPEKEVVKAATPEVAVPDDKPKQDSETNKAFQEMRQKLDAAEKDKAANEQRAKKADELISQQYGHLNVHTVEQYEQRLKQEKEQEDNERYQAAGLTEEEVEKLRKYDELQLETETQKVARQQEDNQTRWGALYTAYPDIVETSKAFNEGKEPEWYNEAMKTEIANGASPLAAYRNAHFDTILQNSLKGTREVAKQEALNQLNSKDHIKTNANTGGEVDHTEISPEQMAIYRRMTGKSDSEIRKFHKKQTAGG